MAERSILFIGNVRGYTALICHALMRGYQVLCTENVEKGLSFINQESIRLVVIVNTTGCMNPVENLSLMEFVELDIPVVLTGENEATIIEAFQSQAPAVLQQTVSREDISDAVECFLNGGQKGATESDCLTFKQGRGFVSLELSTDKNGQKVQGRIRRAVTFMQENYDEELSLDQIAHAAYLNPYYFCRLFKKQMGLTCSKYLSILRIEKAKESLRGTDLSVTEICFTVGFNSLTHFERVFKGLEGITPSAYRRSY